MRIFQKDFNFRERSGIIFVPNKAEYRKEGQPLAKGGSIPFYIVTQTGLR